jgi:hypothetical protein
MNQEKRICKKCLLRDMAEQDQKNLKKYLSAIKEEDRVNEAAYENRLSICTKCDFLQEATCLACGCYVEFRALGKRTSCPKKKW